MKDKIQEAIARGEAAHRAAKDAEAEAAREKAAEDKRKNDAWLASCRARAERWIESHMLDVIEAATARGERSIDLDDVAYCTGGVGSAEVLFEVCHAAGVPVSVTTHAHTDYETGNPTGRYYDRYRLTW